MSRYNNLSYFKARQVTVATSGTPVQGPDISVAPGVATIIKGHPDNTGKIFIANNSTDADKTSSNHLVLEPNQSLKLHVQNFNRIWVDADNNSDKAELIAESN